MNQHDQIVSRRAMVGLVSAPVIAAALNGTLKAAELATTAPADTNNLGARVYNIRDFGAAGDGKTLDSKALQAAIDACNRDQGGTVLVPAGDFVIGTVELKSNVTLHLSAAGRLLGSTKPADYSRGRGIPPGNGNMVMISAADAQNITIEGPGTIDGQGATFYTGYGDGTGPGSSTQRNVDRPHLLIFHNCTNLKLRDAFFTRSAYHCCRILECQNVNIDGIRIYNRVNQNNDGFHIDASQHVTISNCTVICQDDGCSLFGSNQFITVTNCVFSTRWSVFRFGGGQANNIAVSNCLLYEVYGCPIKMACGGGSHFENMSFSNLIFKDVTGPITLGLSARGRRRNAATTSSATQPSGPTLRNISFNNIHGTVALAPQTHADMPFAVKARPGETRQCIVINGTGDAFIENISFTDINLTFAGGGTADEAKAEVPQVAGEYFEIGTPPAYGMFARNVRGLSLSNVRLTTENPDLRPAILFERVQDASVNGLSVQGNPQAESTLRMVNSKDVLLSGTRLLSEATTFLKVEGEASANLIVDGGDFSKAAKPQAAENGASETAVKIRA